MIIIDSRETKLISFFIANGLPFTQEVLDLGDIIIRLDGMDDILIERKTIDDLDSSIKDGRYHEQKNRLMSKIKHGYSYYIVEGTKQKSEKVVGAIINTTIRDGIHVLRTTDVGETAGFVIKIEKCIKEKGFYYKNDDKGVEEQDEVDVHAIPQELCSMKKNMNPNQCFLNMLCCIPQISKVTATEIMKHCTNMEDFIDLLRRDDMPKIKGIGKKTIENIKMFMNII